MFLKKLRRFIIFRNAYKKALNLEFLGDYNLAFKAFLSAIAINSDSLEINNAMIRVAEKNRKPDIALDFLDAAIRKFPTHAEYYAKKAAIYRNLKEFDSALSMYEKASELDDRQISYYTEHARINYYKGDIQGAINDCSLAILKDAGLSDLYSQRGFYRFERKNYESSALDYSKAIELNPKNSHLYFMKAAAEYLTGQKDSAEKDFKKANSLGLNIPEGV